MGKSKNQLLLGIQGKKQPWLTAGGSFWRCFGAWRWLKKDEKGKDCAGMDFAARLTLQLGLHSGQHPHETLGDKDLEPNGTLPGATSWWLWRKGQNSLAMLHQHCQQQVQTTGKCTWSGNSLTLCPSWLVTPTGARSTSGVGIPAPWDTQPHWTPSSTRTTPLAAEMVQDERWLQGCKSLEREI